MPQIKPARKKKIPNRIPIHHDISENARHENHKINKAIKRINQIVRLIFKNTKDSQAITTGSGGSVTMPAQRNPAEDLRFQELYKVIKSMNVNIPKKFDSKAALREFFYSREFILTIKIKMTDSLHNAVLASNNVPRHVIEPQSENAQAAC